MSPKSYKLLHTAILFLKCVAKVRLYFVRNKYFLNKFEKTRFRKDSEAWQSFVEIIYIKCQYFRGSTSVLSREYCCTLAEVLEYSAGNIVECKGRLSFFVYKKKQCPDEIQTDVSSVSREYCCTLAEVLEYSAGNIVECKGRLSFFVYKKKQCPDEIQTDVSSGCILFPGIFKEVLEYSAGNIVECKGRLSFFVYKKKQCPDEIQTDVSSGCILFPGIFKYLFIPIAYRFKFGFFSTSLGG